MFPVLSLIAAALLGGGSTRLDVPVAPQGGVGLDTGSARPKIVLVVLDDVGVDLIGAYDESPVAPCTPVLDKLAHGGLLFRNAWTNPNCSPSRAQILTGRYAFRTGVGETVGIEGFHSGLSVDELLLPEALAGYRTAALGKWHLAHPSSAFGQGVEHPLNSGFDYFAGSTYNLSVGAVGCGLGCSICTPPYGYTNWVKNTNGVQECTQTYATSDTVDEAIQAAAFTSDPWFLYVAFNAAHSPLHDVPPELCPAAGACWCATTGEATNAERYKAMVEVMDAEIGRMLTAIYALYPDVFVFVIGDNGTGKHASEGPAGGCFDPQRAKGTMYEAGINVPLIAAGPGIEPGEVTALVSSTDLFATITELAGSPVSTEDSVSLVPYLRGSTEALRDNVYAERFRPNGIPLDPALHLQALRDERFKLIRETTGGVTIERLFDLLRDPCETTDLCAEGPCPDTLEGVARAAYLELLSEMLALTGAPE